MLDPSRSNSPPPFTVLDKVKCSLFVPVESIKNSSNSVHFITASGEGSDIVYFYTYEGRGQGYPVEGKTTGLYWFRNYLVVTYQARYLLISQSLRTVLSKRMILTNIKFSLAIEEDFAEPNELEVCLVLLLSNQASF